MKALIVRSLLALVMLQFACQNEHLPNNPSKTGLRRSGYEADSVQLPPVDVIIMDSVSEKKFKNRERLKKAGTSQEHARHASQDPGNEYLFVGGMNLQQALELTAHIFNTTNATTVT